MPWCFLSPEPRRAPTTAPRCGRPFSKPRSIPPVYGTGLPTYDSQYTLTEAGPGQWKLSGTVTQSGVPRGWKDVLPLYAEVNKNVFRVGTINVTEPVVKFEEILPVKPARVALCLNEDTIGIIKQP